eukprot:TRINITY_DN63883_c0_g1_i1.p1 TRINITY_DN63883_c0_g1~~TRINITY_DN63883_c0_g1_i1.p1  ORF type:complete len:164 (+),score=20.56 TRINITY_DN63883_c0_g1_i1:86-577(+)
MEEAMSGLVAMSGASVPPRAVFLGKFVSTTTLGSVTVGLACGQVGSFFPCGPLIPFMAGSCCGYIFACVSFWKGELRKAMQYAEQYPALMESAARPLLGICMAPQETFGDWLRVGGLFRKSYAIMAAQACEAAVSEICSSDRQRIIDSYIAQAAAESAEQSGK